MLCMCVFVFKVLDLLVDVIHGNLRCYRTVHIEDDLPGLSVDAVQFPGKLCIQLQNLKLSE